MSQRERAASSDGAVTDETLIDALARLSVVERLELNDAAMRTALELRSAFARRRDDREDGAPDVQRGRDDP